MHDISQGRAVFYNTSRQKEKIMSQNCKATETAVLSACNQRELATRLIPLVDWPKFHPWPPVGGLRHLAFFRDSNGFSKAFVKIGRRILIDEAEFLKQIRSQNETKIVANEG